MKRLGYLLKRSPLLKRLLQVVGGNSAAQLMVLIAAPVITRIYSPEVFGMQGVFLSAVSLLAPLIALRYPMAVVVSRGNREIRQAEQVSVSISLLTCGLLFLLLVVVREPVSTLLGLEEIGLLILFVPVMLFFTAMQEVTSYRAARFNRFKEVSIVTVVQAILINGGRIIAGLFAPVAFTLVVISTIGPGLHAVMLTAMTKSRRVTRPVPRESLRSLKSFMKKKKEFPLFRAPADFMNAASQALPVILLTVFSGPAIAGFYTLARSMLNLPANVIGSAIGNVFYAHFADRAREHNALLGIALRSTMLLLVGPGLLIVVVCLFAPDLFALVFGAQWRDAGIYAQWMSLWIAFALANVPSVRLAPVIGKQGVLLISHISTLVLRIGSMIIAQLIARDPLTVVIAYSVASAAGNAGLVATMLIFTRKFDRRNLSLPQTARWARD